MAIIFTCRPCLFLSPWDVLHLLFVVVLESDDIIWVEIFYVMALMIPACTHRRSSFSFSTRIYCSFTQVNASAVDLVIQWVYWVWHSLRSSHRKSYSPLHHHTVLHYETEPNRHITLDDARLFLDLNVLLLLAQETRSGLLSLLDVPLLLNCLRHLLFLKLLNNVLTCFLIA